ncbi:MAG: TetR/AcrR family transcriptional regulator [Planctomycetaceae bacterium]|nr:TetR/AcrR family transcriptional regulator [Planctomycetaceae bacterium]
MKVSREQVARHHEQILETAARLFRERGFEGIGVAQLMAEVGLTHGGFYGHFTSKDHLAAEACARAFEEKYNLWTDELKGAGAHPEGTVARRYLAARHRDDAGTGCPAACWAAEMPRQSPGVRRRFTEGFSRLVDILTERLPGRSHRRRREKALATWASLVGAIVLARAVDDAELSGEILRAMRSAFSELATADGDSFAPSS